MISVDTKKKELVGNYKNPGTDWRRKGQPRRVNDFENKKLGNPYGVYDGYFCPSPRKGKISCS